MTEHPLIAKVKEVQQQRWKSIFKKQEKIRSKSESLKNNVRKKDKIQKMTDDEKSIIARFQRPDQGTYVQDHKV